MKFRKQTYAGVLAALAGAAFLAAPAIGQMRVDTSGHAMDANTQVGSGGLNQTSTNTPVWTQYQNALVTNNARNGFAFRGPTFNGINLGVGYTDPFAFRGLVAGQGVDQFIANSVGVPTMSDPTASSSLYAQPSSPQQIFYGLSNHSVAPPGTDQVGSAQVGASGTVGSAGYTLQQPMSQSPQDLRLGTIDYTAQTQILPKPDQVVVPGPVDSSVNPSASAQQLLDASDLWGTLQINNQNSLQLGQPNSNQNSNNGNNPNNNQPNQQSSIFGSPAQQNPTMGLGPTPVQSRIREIRQELTGQTPSQTGAVLVGSNPNQANGNASLLKPLQPGGENSSFDQPLPEINSDNSLLKSSSLTPAAGDVGTEQSNRVYMPSEENLPPPTQQSAIYAKLRQSMEEYNSTNSMTDEEANRKFQEIRHLQELANTNAENGGNVLTGPGAAPAATPGALPPEIPAPGENAVVAPKQEAVSGTSQSKTESPNFNTLPTNMGAGPGMGVPPASAPPVPIDSFAAGIKSKGLSDLIASAEANVEQGHYDRAIAQYNEAIDAAPNNPLILLARATAELGGGYYAQANADIHVAVAQDPAVLLGQYDLQKHLGPQRVKSLVADLKQISQDSPDDTLHSFLLTFTYYNSHHVGQAAQWLETTDKRSGGQDPAIIQMKRYWNFSEDQQPGAKSNSPAPSGKH